MLGLIRDRFRCQGSALPLRQWPFMCGNASRLDHAVTTNLTTNPHGTHETPGTTMRASSPDDGRNEANSVHAAQCCDTGNTEWAGS